MIDRVLDAAGLTEQKYLEYDDGKHHRRRRITRAHYRVMRALLDTSGLSGYPLSRVAKVGAGKVYVVLADLESAGWVAGEWEQRDDGQPRRRCYSLTPAGREGAAKLIEEEDRKPAADSWNRAAARIALVSMAVLAAGAVFTSVTMIIWPEHLPVWAERMSAAPIQVGILLAVAAALILILRRGRS